MKQEAEKLKKNAENSVSATKTSVPATETVPAMKIQDNATKKQNTTGTSEGAGWVVPTMTEEIEEKKVEKTAEGVVLKEDPKYLAGAISLMPREKWNLFSTPRQTERVQTKSTTSFSSI